MAARRRRTNNTPAEVAPVEPTHEEMLEVAAEREAEAQVEETPEDEEKAIEAIMSMALADTFEAIWQAEKENGVEDFFDPSYYTQPTPPPVAPKPEPKPLITIREPRYLIRENRSPKYRRG